MNVYLIEMIQCYGFHGFELKLASVVSIPTKTFHFIFDDEFIDHHEECKALCSRYTINTVVDQNYAGLN